MSHEIPSQAGRASSGKELAEPPGRLGVMVAGYGAAAVRRGEGSPVAGGAERTLDVGDVALHGDQSAAVVHVCNLIVATQMSCAEPSVLHIFNS